MTMLSKVRAILARLVLTECSPSRLALSCSIGVFVAFSPFIGFHTIMMLALAWFGRLNFAVVYAASHVVNNPFTVAPLYWLNHIFGKQLCQLLFGFLPANPLWMNWINAKIILYTGLPGVSLWAFMLGGNLLGLMVSVMLYPIMIWIFNRMTAKQTTTAA